MSLATLWGNFLNRVGDFLSVPPEEPAKVEEETQGSRHTVIKVHNYLVKPGSDEGTYLVYDYTLKVYRMMDRKQFEEEFAVTPPEKGHEIIVETIWAAVVRETIAGPVMLGQDTVTCEKS